MTMTGKEMLVRAHDGDKSLGMSFEKALALAMAHDDFAADQLEIQARELGIEPRKVE